MYVRMYYVCVYVGFDFISFPPILRCAFFFTCSFFFFACSALPSTSPSDLLPRRSLITHFANPSFSPSFLVAFPFSYLCLANQYYAHCSDFPLLHIRSPNPQTCLTYCTLFDFLARLADVYSSLILHDSPLLTIKQPPNKAPPFLLLANRLL